MRSSLYLICDQGIITKQMDASYRYHYSGISGTTFLEWWCNQHRILQDDRHFIATVFVDAAPTFYAWVATFGRRMKIKYPPAAVEGMKEFLAKAASMYE